MVKGAPKKSRSEPGMVKVGISGWRYKPWRGVFYPETLSQKEELHFASRQLPTIEINGTFYNLQRPEYFEHWATETPADFIFAVKCPRFITHIKRIKDVEAPLANFYATGVLKLGPKLGPFLWQFPPSFKFDAERIEAFFRLLPKDAAAAASLARRHSDRPFSRPIVRADDNRPLRHAMEIRNDSFRDPAFIALLRKYDVAVVCADTVEWPRLMDLTSDFVYCRLHGSEVLYTSGYDDESLDRWAARIAAWARGGESPDGDRAGDRPAPKRASRDVFVYFDNDVKVRAPRDAHSLIVKLEKLLDRRLGSATAVGESAQHAMDAKATAAPAIPGPRARGRLAAERHSRPAALRDETPRATPPGFADKRRTKTKGAKSKKPAATLPRLNKPAAKAKPKPRKAA
jgi:uncharacterized protein YecE (DUF72 family)